MIYTPYIITTIGRSGSSLLCETLAKTGVMGEPLEYFNKGFPNGHPRINGTPHTLGYFFQIAEQTASSNGVFGFKTSWESFTNGFLPLLGDFRLLKLIRPFMFHLSRRDLVGQTISLHRSITTKVWAVKDDVQVDQHKKYAYDLKALEDTAERIFRLEQQWFGFYQRYGVRPEYLWYENIASHVEAVVDGMTRTVTGGIAEFDTVTKQRVMRDELTQEIRERLIAESTKLPRLVSRWEDFLQRRSNYVG